jgi:subtilisin
MKRLIVTALVTLAVLMSGIGGSMAAPSETGGYIVVLHDRVDQPAAAAREITRQVGGRVGFIYQHALKGFSITVPPQALAALEAHPMVKYIATDDVRYAFGQSMPTGIERIFADTNGAIDIDGTDDFRVDVDVAVIDTGVDFEHPDLNVVGGVNCSGGWPWNSSCKSGGDDDHYHGTHVAGTIGAIDNGTGVVGVAPGARLWAVKVLNSRGSGYTSWIVAGIDWVAANAATIEVANMSLGGSGFNQAEYDAIQGAVNKGVAFAVAAGNSDADASNYSPAAFDNVLTVSALADFDGEPGGLGSPTCRNDQDDTLADFSNWGSAVDVAAPGVCILSTYPIEQGEYGTISGTSMASPHAAGALALLASASSPKNATDVYYLYKQVIDTGNFNWTDDSGDGIHEPLLDVSNVSIFAPVLIAGSGGGGGNTAPVVTINSPADGAVFNSGTSISFEGTATDNDDGDLTAGLAWTSNRDGSIGTGGSVSKVLSDGTHTIEAEVIDSGGLSGSDSITVTVLDGSGGGGFPISLTVNAYKVRGAQYADLVWSGANSTNVDVYRDGGVVVTTANDGAYTDVTGQKGGGSHSYQVCEAGAMTTCSDTVTVSW